VQQFDILSAVFGAEGVMISVDTFSCPVN